MTGSGQNVSRGLKPEGISEVQPQVGDKKLVAFLV